MVPGPFGEEELCPEGEGGGMSRGWGMSKEGVGLSGVGVGMSGGGGDWCVHWGICTIDQILHQF